MSKRRKEPFVNLFWPFLLKEEGGGRRRGGGGREGRGEKLVLHLV